MVFDGDAGLLPLACQIYQAVVRVIAVVGPHEICGAGELVIAAERRLRIIRVGFLRMNANSSCYLVQEKLMPRQSRNR